MPEAWLDTVLAHFDQGTQRAILRLYRSSPSDVLATAGERPAGAEMPALVVWGERDPYIPARFAPRVRARAPDAELLELADAGHWPWLDRPDAIERVVEFLAAPSSTRDGGLPAGRIAARSSARIGEAGHTLACAALGARAGRRCPARAWPT